jgi:hypothetical protein
MAKMSPSTENKTRRKNKNIGRRHHAQQANAPLTLTMAAVTNSSLFASRAAVGSSRSRIGLGLKNARAMAMRCF